MFGFEKRRSTPVVQERMLPSDVRYALQYKEAKLGTSEMLDLARNGFEREALYACLKASAPEPALQKAFLSDLAAMASARHEEGGAEGDLRKEMRDQAERIITQLPKESTADSMKLAQLSRQGFEFWEAKHADAAKRYAHDPDATFIVGHSMFIGIIDFMRSHAHAEKPLHVLMPPFIGDPAQEASGYRIENARVEFLPKDFTRVEAVVIDDVLNTGATTRSLQEFWSADGTSPAPRFEYLFIS